MHTQSAYLANLFGQKHDPMAALLRKQATSQALQHQRSSVLQHQPTSNGLALHSSQPSLVTSRAPSHAMSRLPPSYSLHHQATSSRVGAGRCHHLRRVHLRLIQQMGFSPADFDAGLGYFRESLQELGAPEVRAGNRGGKWRSQEGMFSSMGCQGSCACDALCLTWVTLCGPHTK